MIGKTTYMRTNCEYCNDPLEGNNPKKRFCSDKCRVYYNRELNSEEQLRINDRQITFILWHKGYHGIPDLERHLFGLFLAAKTNTTIMFQLKIAFPDVHEIFIAREERSPKWEKYLRLFNNTSR